MFLRVVADLDIDPAGHLRPRPGVPWRVEPARREAGIHRKLAALADAPAFRIVAFASAHGLLRRPVPSPLDLPEAASRALTTATGQEAADNAARLREWLEAGAQGDPPSGTSDALVATAIYASLPDRYLRAFERSFTSSEAAPAFSAETFLAGFLPGAAAIAPVASFLADEPALVAEIGPPRLLSGLRLYEWAVRILAGLDEAPAAITTLGGPDALLRAIFQTMPEAADVPELLDGPNGQATRYVHSLTQESVEDWHAAARVFRDHVQTVRLLHRALGGQGVSAGEKAALLDLYTDAAGYRPRVPLSAAEVAERARPLLTARMEGELAAARSWPLRRGGVAGLYVRGLVALWADLAETAPPLSCATPGCAVTLPPTRNRRYCDICQAARRRQSVRRTRARPLEVG